MAVKIVFRCQSVLQYRHSSLCTLVGHVAVFEWWGQVWWINFSGRPDAGLAWKCFLRINNAGRIWGGMRACRQYSKRAQCQGGGWSRCGQKGGLAFVIKPRTDPAYPREAVGNRRGDGCMRMSGLTEPLTNKLMKQCGNTVGRDEPQDSRVFCFWTYCYSPSE